MHGIKHSRSQSLIDYAYKVAKEAHGEQKRKYTGEPYINHPVEVAQIVASVTDDCEMICAALLHDVIEDTSVTIEDLRDLSHGFNESICSLVQQLTDKSKPEDGNRATRKAIDRKWIAGASARAKTVKLADLISNSDSIIKHDPNFAKVYLREKRLLLNILKEGDSKLWHRANEILIREGY